MMTNIEGEHTQPQKRNARRHALWLAAAAIGVYVTYIAYLYVFTHVN